MALTVTVLGCSGSYPGPGGACSGYLVQGGGVSVWVDAGAGTMANLQDHLPLTEVDAIVLSHEHPDHRSDVDSFYVACRHGIDREGVPVFAPAGLRDHVYFSPPEPWLEWHEIADGGRIDLGDLRFTFSRTDHGPETLAMRIEGEGRALGYSADSGPAWSLEALGPNIDLALCEASFHKEQEGMAQHLSARQAGASARAAGVGRLLLTHLWPTLDPERSRAEGSAAFGAPVDLAVTHQRYEV